MACETCKYWNFAECKILMPCPKIRFPFKIIGTVTKPIGNGPDSNLEALFLENSERGKDEYFRHAYGLAKRRNLGFLSLKEFEVLGRTAITPERRRRILDPFNEENYILCPLTWVQETRMIKKFCHRMYFQGFELSENFLEVVAKQSGDFAEVSFDKGTKSV